MKMHEMMWSHRTFHLKEWRLLPYIDERSKWIGEFIRFPLVSTRLYKIDCCIHAVTWQWRAFNRVRSLTSGASRLRSIVWIFQWIETSVVRIHISAPSPKGSVQKVAFVTHQIFNSEPTHYDWIDWWLMIVQLIVKDPVDEASVVGSKMEATL